MNGFFSSRYGAHSAHGLPKLHHTSVRKATYSRSSSSIATKLHWSGHEQTVQTRAARRDTGLLDFVQWAIKANIQFTNVRPEVSAAVRGVFATFPVQTGQTILSVPTSAALSIGPNARCPFPDFVPASCWDHLPWWVQLALKLCFEKTQGRQSKWAQYLAVLPTRVDLPLFWPSHLIHELQYPYLEDKLLQERRQWEELKNKLLPYISAHGLSVEDLEWAVGCVRSRTFAGPYVATPFSAKATTATALAGLYVLHGVLGAVDLPWPAPVTAALMVALPGLWFAWDQRNAQSSIQYAICPFIDMLNHSSKVESECSYNILRDCYQVSATEMIAPGQQVFINYGSQSNDQLLQLYGFVEQDNAHDRHVVPDVLPALHKLGMGLSLTEADASQRSLFQNVVITTAGFEPQVADAIRQLQSIHQQQSPSAPAASSKVLHELLIMLLASHSSTLEDDLQQLQQVKDTLYPPTVPAMAEQVATTSAHQHAAPGLAEDSHSVQHHAQPSESAQPQHTQSSEDMPAHPANLAQKPVASAVFTAGDITMEDACPGPLTSSEPQATGVGAHEIADVFHSGEPTHQQMGYVSHSEPVYTNMDIMHADPISSDGRLSSVQQPVQVQLSDQEVRELEARLLVLDFRIAKKKLLTAAASAYS